MKVSVQLVFNQLDFDIRVLIHNLKLEFCEFSFASDLKKLVPDKIVDQRVLDQIQQTGIGSFFAKKDDIPFEVIIYWKKSQLEVRSLDNHKQAGLEFYIDRCIEVCHNFAMLELIADEGGVHELGKHLEESF